MSNKTTPSSDSQARTHSFMLYIFLVGAYLITTASAIILFKQGTADSRFALNSIGVDCIIHYRLPLGITLYIASFMLWMAVLSLRPITYIVPLTTGLSQLMIIGAGYFILKERITLVQMIGIALILCGTVLITARKQ